MRLRMMLLAAFSALLILAVLMAPAFLILRDSATQAVDRILTVKVRELAQYVLEGPTVEEALAFAETAEQGTIVHFTIVGPDGTVYGEDAAKLAGLKLPWLVRPMWPWKATPELLYVNYSQEGAERVATISVPDGTQGWQVSARVHAEDIAAQEAKAWTQLIGLSALALLVAVTGGGILALRLSRTVERAAAAADQVGRGDFLTTVPETGPPELVRLATNLNTMSRRVQTMLEAERQRAAELSHRLRTPLTALHHAAERLTATAPGATPSDDAKALKRSIEHLEGELDQVIVEARQIREDVAASDRHDVSDLVRQSLAFWEPLAIEDHRHLAVDIPRTPLIVRIRERDLVNAMDVLIGNVFRHTPDGTAFTVSVRKEADDVAIAVADEGPGPSTSSAGQHRGSTGLGLEIAEKIAHQAGGDFAVSTVAGGTGTVARLRLPVVSG